jgi:YD repeat-containing protein
VSGTPGAEGSTVLRRSADGHEALFTWTGTGLAYASTDGDGADDTLVLDDANGVWIWTEGSSQATDRYDAATGLLSSASDAEGRTVSFNYADGVLSSVTDVESGHTLRFEYVAGRLTRLLSFSSPTATAGTQEALYGYDGLGRLASVTLTVPGDAQSHVTTYAYLDSTQQVASVTASDGTRISFTYQDVGGQRRVASVTDAAGTTQFGYDGSTAIITDASGRTWRYIHDANGRLATIEAPDGNDRVFTWTASGNLETVTDALGRTTQWQYDLSGNRTQETDAAGNVVRWRYSASNQLENEIRYSKPATGGPGAWVLPGNATALVTRFAYDAQNRLRFKVSAEGRVTEYRYHPNHLLKSEIVYTDPAYSLASLSPLQRVTVAHMNAWVSAEANRPEAQRTDFLYDGLGNLSKRTVFAELNANGSGQVSVANQQYNYQYDAYGRLLQIADRAGGVQSLYTYDGAGRVLSELSAAGTATYSYDALNHTVTRTVTRAGGSGKVTIQRWNQSGQLESIMESALNETPRETLYSHDDAGRVVRTINAENGRSYSFYDETGRLVGQVNAVGELTEYVHDAAGQLVSEIRYGTRVATSAFWAGNTRLVTTLAEVKTQNALTALTPVRTTTYTYDEAGRRTETINDDGIKTITTWDGAGRVLSVKTKNRKARYFYDKDGLLLATLDAAGYLTTRNYDAAGRLSGTVRFGVATDETQRNTGTLSELLSATVLAGSQLETRHFHDGAGRLIGVLDERGFLTTNTYDEAARTQTTTRYRTPWPQGVMPSELQTLVDQIMAATPPGSDLADVSVSTFDEHGRLVEWLRENGRRTTYHYDSDGNLDKETDNAGTAEERLSRYRYDAFGQRTGVLVGELAAGTDEQTIAARFNTHGLRYHYDRLGRVARATDLAGNITTFYYDAASRLVYTINGAGDVVSSTYTEFGELAQTRRYATQLDTVNAGAGGARNATIRSAVDALANDQTDNRVTQTWGNLGQLVRSTNAEGFRTRFFYNDFGELRRQDREQSPGTFAVDEFTYNERGELLTATRDTGLLNELTQTTYDAYGRVETRTDARGLVTRFEYPDSGRRVITVDPLDARRTTTYDYQGRVLTVSDATGAVTEYRYNDAAGELTVITPELRTTTSTLNAFGQTVRVTDASGGVTAYAYNLSGDLETTEIAADTAAALTGETRVYDEFGRLWKVTDALGITTRLEYDAAGRVAKRINEVTGEETAYVFDGQGRQVAVTESWGPVGARQQRVTAYAYDRNGAVLHVTHDPTGLALRTTYTWDGEGRQLTVAQGTATASEQQKTEYRYDALGRRQQEIRDPGEGRLNITTAYRYDAAGNLTRRIDAEQNSTWFVYDNAGRQRLEVDARGYVTENIRDQAGRLVKRFRYVQPLPAAQLSSLGDVVAALDIPPDLQQAGAELLSFTTYDKDGLVRYELDAAGLLTEFVRDGLGRVIDTVRHAADASATASVFEWLSDLSDLGRFENAAQIGDQTDVTFWDSQNGYLVLRAAIGEAGAPDFTVPAYTYAEDALPGQKYTFELRTGTTLPSAVFGGMFESGAGLTPGELTSVENGFGDGVVLLLIGGKLVAGGRYEAEGATDGYQLVTGTTYNVVMETGVGSVSVRLYDDTPEPLPGEPAKIPLYTYTYRTAPWNAVRLAFSGVAFQTFNNGEVYVDNIAHHRGAPVDGQHTRQIYDARGNVRFIVNALNQVMEQRHDAAGQLTATRQYAGALPLTHSVWTVEAIAAAIGEPVDTAGVRQTRILRDAAGRERFVVDASGLGVSEKIYDGLGRVIEERQHALLTAIPESTHTADALALLLETRQLDDTLSTRSTRFVHDTLGRLRFTLDAAGYLSENVHDAMGRVVSQTRYALPVSAAVRESTQLLDEQTLAGEAQLQAGQFVFAFGSLALNRQTRFVYDARGELVYRIDSDLFLTAYVRDHAGRVIRETQYATRVPAEVAAHGLNPSALAVAGALSALASSNDRSTHYRYDAAGNACLTIDALGYVTWRDYDGFGRVTQQRSYEQAVALPDDAETYAALSAPEGRVGALASTPHRLQGWVYDMAGRVVAETRDSGSGEFVVQTAGGQVAASRYTALTEYGYDGFGNLAEKREGIASAQPLGGGDDITDNSAARITRYEFDVLGRQTASIAPGWYDAAQQRFFAGRALPEAPLAEETRFQVRTEVRYDGFGDAALQRVRTGMDTWANTHRGYDELGRLRFEIDAVGYVTQHTYDGFGNLRTSTRYAAAVTELPASTDSLSAAWLFGGESPRLTADAARDRTLTTGYDALGRKVRVEQMAVDVYLYSGDIYAAASRGTPEVTYRYNAFGDVGGRNRGRCRHHLLGV